MLASDTTAVLPPLYAGWIDALLEAPIPSETRATCDDCAMCAPEGEQTTGSGLYFSPRIKCCTYIPRLPNYLVGRALEDDDFAFSAGRATLEKRIDDGVGVTPLGLDQGRRFLLLYRNSLDAFGRAATMRCPHYLEEAGGRCGVWKHRNSICATWFCKHERGAVGFAFWHRVRDLLSVIESDLSAWCVLESDLDPEALGLLFPERPRPGTRDSLTAADVDRVAEPSVARRLWANWFGREREFYRRCARKVKSLNWDDVARIGGSEVAVRARLTQKAYEALRSEELPERLTAGGFQIISTRIAGASVISYSPLDPLDLDPDVLRILPYFEGRPISQAIEAIESEVGVRVEEDLVRTLADFEILVRSETASD